MSMFAFTEAEIKRAEEAYDHAQAAKRSPDAIPHLCAEIARLCDVLRGERAYLMLCTVYPSHDASATARVRAGQLREQNCLVLLREKRNELVDAVEALAS